MTKIKDSVVLSERSFKANRESAIREAIAAGRVVSNAKDLTNRRLIRMSAEELLTTYERERGDSCLAIACRKEILRRLQIADEQMR